MAVVSLFDEVLLDPDLFTAGGATGGPQYANTIIKNPATGIYKVNVNRYDFQQVWDMQCGLLEQDDLARFMEFWGGGFGSAVGFRVMILSDFYVIAEVIGTGNGSQTVFNLTKSYSRPGGSLTYTRRIVKPVVNGGLVSPAFTLYEPNGVTAITIYKDAVAQVSVYTINNKTGVVTFAVAPAGGVVVSWSGEFDTPMRFLQNSFQLRPDIASDIQGLQLCEILPAELGIT
jgi:uncharacterized protein (TIGR02217 family)